MKTETTKLTLSDEQIDRVGVLMNLAEEDYKHLANKVCDMTYDERLVNSMIYQTTYLKRDEAYKLLKMLKHFFQTGIIDDYTDLDSEFVDYIVLGY